jgi:hypothetical protein
MAKLGVEAFREACQGKFGRDIGQEVGHCDLATDRSDIHDGSRSLLNKLWQDGVYALKSGEEVDFHCIPVRLEGLILGRTYSNDASVADQNVEAAKPVQGGVDEVRYMGRVSEIAGEEQDIIDVADRALCKQVVQAAFELISARGNQN